MSTLPNSGVPETRPVLDGVLVVELAGGIAGSAAGVLLADYGARVLKLEPPGGSPLRSAPSFQVLNRGKESVVVDAASEHVATGTGLVRLLCRPHVRIEDQQPALDAPHIGAMLDPPRGIDRQSFLAKRRDDRAVGGGVPGRKTARHQRSRPRRAGIGKDEAIGGFRKGDETAAADHARGRSIATIAPRPKPGKGGGGSAGRRFTCRFGGEYDALSDPGQRLDRTIGRRKIEVPRRSPGKRHDARSGAGARGMPEDEAPAIGRKPADRIAARRIRWE